MRNIAVGGKSACANLATVVSLMACDKKIQIPVHQLFIYPVISNNMNWPSYKTNEDAKPLNKDMLKWLFKYC